MRSTCALLCAISVLAGGASRGGEIGFVEEFALAGDRAEALKLLIPGTRDYYYYTCLHLQNQGRHDDVGKTLKVWINRHGRTSRVREIEIARASVQWPAFAASAQRTSSTSG